LKSDVNNWIFRNHGCTVEHNPSRTSPACTEGA